MGERGGDGGYARRPERVGRRPVPQLVGEVNGVDEVGDIVACRGARSRGD